MCGRKAAEHSRGTLACVHSLTCFLLRVCVGAGRRACVVRCGCDGGAEPKQQGQPATTAAAAATATATPTAAATAATVSEVGRGASSSCCDLVHATRRSSSAATAAATAAASVASLRHGSRFSAEWCDEQRRTLSFSFSCSIHGCQACIARVEIAAYGPGAVAQVSERSKRWRGARRSGQTTHACMVSLLHVSALPRLHERTLAAALTLHALRKHRCRLHPLAPHLRPHRRGNNNEQLECNNNSHPRLHSPPPPPPHPLAHSPSPLSIIAATAAAEEGNRARLRMAAMDTRLQRPLPLVHRRRSRSSEFSSKDNLRSSNLHHHSSSSSSHLESVGCPMSRRLDCKRKRELQSLQACNLQRG